MKNLIITVMLLLLTPSVGFPCKEYKITDFGDHVEAICVGEPLSDKQKQELEKQKEQEHQAQPQEYYRQKDERGIDNNRIKYKSNSEETVTKIEKTIDEGNIVVSSFDVKYIPSGRIIAGRERPGEYSVRIEAKNSGRRATVRFKLKQVDNSGYETESITFSERFSQDKLKTVTTHLSAHQVPFIQNKEWIIEATKN